MIWHLQAIDFFFPFSVCLLTYKPCMYTLFDCGGYMCVHSQRPEVDVGNHIWCSSTYPQKQCLIKTQRSLRRLVLLASLLWEAPVSVTQIRNYSRPPHPPSIYVECGVWMPVLILCLHGKPFNHWAISLVLEYLQKRIFLLILKKIKVVFWHFVPKIILFYFYSILFMSKKAQKY